MGYRNRDRVLYCQPPITDIPHGSWRVLLHMAVLAHDDTQLYWGGLAYLQLAMGYRVGPGGRANIMRHLRILQAHGYVTPTAKKHGTRKVYELHLPGELGHLSAGEKPWP